MQRMSAYHVLHGIQSVTHASSVLFPPLSPYPWDKGGILLHLPIFYSALLLTLVNLVLRFVGTSFQVYLSGRIGAAGIGLLQLVMSVNSLAIVAGIAGIRTASMYLTAEELGKKRKDHISGVLSGCFLYSILFSGTTGFALYTFAPKIAVLWIGNEKTADALRLFAVFLPVICLANVMVGYFTAAGRIGTLSAVEVAEQLISISVTVFALSRTTLRDPVQACRCVILGSCTSAVFTLVCLVFLWKREHSGPGKRIPMARRLRDAALPLAAADVMKSGINTVENLMVPKRLAMNPLISDPLAAFGCVSGMVFPVLMFPACILFGLAELLIPEMSRCSAAGSHDRIRYLARQSLRIAMLYGLVFGGLEFLLGNWLCQRLYHNTEAGTFLRLYALLIPMLYCDAIIDAMTKGLGQQKICVRYNILTASLDVIFLWFLLPRYGMTGYFVSFTVTHLLNFILSLRLLLKITGESIPFYVPAFSLAAAGGAALGAGSFDNPVVMAVVYLLLLWSILCLFQVTGREDLRWVKGLVCKK